jgi:hypothetical protein
MREKVFLAGTDDVKYIMEALEKELKEIGYDPIWFHKKFKLDTEDSMKTCLDNVRASDRLILVLDKSYGLPYRDDQYSITEKEFLTANNEAKPILIFIHQETYAHSRIYRNLKKQGINLTEENKIKYGLKANLELFEFIDRIQHLEKDGKLDIRWRELFDSINDIVEQIKLKWAVHIKDTKVGETDRYYPIKKMIKTLEKYEDIKDNNLREIECTQELGLLFPELQKIGFRYASDRKTTIKDNNYEVIFKPIPTIHTFLIRKLRKGMRGKEPFEQYFSKKKYVQSETNQSDRQVLFNFINYLKEILGIEKIDPIQIVLCSLYHSYRASPSSLIMGDGMLDAINSRLGEGNYLKEKDLVYALDYLESKGIIRQSKVLESNIPFDIKILPKIVDFAKDC